MRGRVLRHQREQRGDEPLQAGRPLPLPLAGDLLGQVARRLAQPIQRPADQIDREGDAAVVDVAGGAAREAGVHADQPDAGAVQPLFDQQHAGGGDQVIPLAVAQPPPCRGAVLQAFGSQA